MQKKQKKGDGEGEEKGEERETYFWGIIEVIIFNFFNGKFLL